MYWNISGKARSADIFIWPRKTLNAIFDIKREKFKSVKKSGDKREASNPPFSPTAAKALKMTHYSWTFHSIKQAQESLGSCDKLSSAKLFNLDGAMKNATYAHNEYNVCLLLKKSTKLQELDLNCPHVMLNKKH